MRTAFAVDLGAVIGRLDGFQQRHAALGFPLAVRRKFSEDRGGYLAATIAYYGFFSLFPLLLLLVTILGYVLSGDESLQHRVVRSALAQFPVIGPDLKQHGLGGNPVALAVGIIGAIWTGTGVLLAAEHAMNSVWDLPPDHDLGFVASRLRALGLLAVLGGSLLVTTGLSGASASGSLGTAVRIGVAVVTLLVSFLVFWLAFRLLTPSDIASSSFRGGAAAAAVGYGVLQLVGSVYVDHVVRNASNVYGTFALVIGLLSWIYLLAVLFVITAEGNVVAAKRLWPRSLRKKGEPDGTSLDGRRPPAAAERPGRRPGG
jgi:YihY family inner membrane protein